MLVGLDTEATGLNRWRGHRPFSIAFYFENDEKLFIEWDIDPCTRVVKPRKKDIKRINEITRDPGIEKIYWNRPYDEGMLSCFGVEFEGPRHDAMIGFKCLKSDEPAGLKDFGENYLDIPKDDETALHKAVQEARKEAKKKGWAIATAESHPEGKDGEHWKSDYWLCRKLSRVYNMKDAERTLLGWLLIEPQLHKEKVYHVYKREMRFMPIVRKAEERGHRVFLDYIDSQIKSNLRKAKNAERTIRKYGGKDFNANSHVQVSKLVYGKLKFEPKHFTKGGNPSTKIKHIKKLKHPVIEAIVGHESWSRAAVMFESYKFNAIKEGKIEVIHPNFNQWGARTNRMSCSRPNLQNVRNEVTSKSDVPIDVRKAFGPRPGYVNIHIDYSQIEIWIYGARGGDTKLLGILKKGGDIHGEVAKRCFWRDIEAAKGNQAKLDSIRVRSKMVNFGIRYGSGPNGIVEIHDCTYAEAVKWISDVHRAFPKSARHMRRVAVRAERKGFVTTGWGRKLQVPSGAGYKGVNYEVQGDAAEQIKDASITADKFFIKRNLDARIILWVHDELVIEWRKDQLKKFLVRKLVRKIEKTNGHIPSLDKLPVKVEIVKDNWGSAEAYAI